MSNRRCRQSNTGMTLIELIVVMAILVVVIAAIGSVLVYGQRAFRQGENQSALQNDIRLVAERISKDIRYAENFSIHTTMPALDEQYKYIYVESGKIMRRIGSGTPEVLLGSEGTASLSFTRANDRLVSFTLGKTNLSRTFSVQTDVDLMNLRENTIAGTSGSCIRFGPVSDQEAVAYDAANLSLVFAPLVGNITLPTSGLAGSTISWRVESGGSALTVVGGTGTVNRPGIGSPDVSVLLTATISRYLVNDTKTFTLTVKAHSLDDVTVDIRNGLLGETVASMEYQVSAAGPWIHCTDGVTTGIVYAEGDLRVRHASVERLVMTIPARAAAPAVTLSSTNSNSAEFRLSGIRVTSADQLEYSYDGGPWTEIGDTTTVRTNGGNHVVIVRVRATPSLLPSLETGDLDS